MITLLYVDERNDSSADIPLIRAVDIHDFVAWQITSDFTR